MVKLGLWAQIDGPASSRPGMCSAMSLMLSLCTPTAVVLSTTNNHLEWLGRDRDGVIGHRCSEWASPSHWDLSWHLFQRSLSTGMPLAWERSVVTLDGSPSRGQVTVKPLMTRRHGLLAVCVNRVVGPHTGTGLGADIMRCLAEVTQIIPRVTLQQSLEELAADAAGVAERSFGPLH